jgi:hypothetical protein
LTSISLTTAARLLVQTPVAVEKLFSRDFRNEIRSQVIESLFAAGAEIHRDYWFGSFFNSHAC